MKDIEQANNFLTMAKKDYQALIAMKDEEKIAIEIFGFHVQQAVEKTLKAWLCFAGVMFPRIHDLDELAAMLRDVNITIPHAFEELLPYTDFAVTFRYDAFPEFEATIDRERITALVYQLITHVEKLIKLLPITNL